MDFPIFHLDLFGNRLLIAVIATVHVLINHMLAVGAIPLVTFLQWRGLKTGDQRWDDLAYRLLFFCFIITTTLGALTGVGIWFSTSLVNPGAIGSLIRVFFWAWFFEWAVFVTEVVLIMAYFLSWKTRWAQQNKGKHVGLGVVLSIASWLTMAVIVAILGFQMDTGVWTVQPGFWTAVLNPIYLPQLFFRTPFALVTAALLLIMLTGFFTRRDPEFRGQAVRTMSVWALVFTLPMMLGAWSYWRVIPERMLANLDTALTTLSATQFLDPLRWLILASVVTVVAVCLWGVWAPRRLPSVILIVPVLLAVWQLSYFERVREFIRKPDVIASYMYSNGLRAADYPMYREDGLLVHAAYVPMDAITDDNRVEAGQEMFRISCSRCHTTHGVNSVVAKLETMYGADATWVADDLDIYLKGMHNARPFMPPLPGNDAERAALVAYLMAQRTQPENLHGAQSHGVAARIN